MTTNLIHTDGNGNLIGSAADLFDDACAEHIDALAESNKLARSVARLAQPLPTGNTEARAEAAEALAEEAQRLTKSLKRLARAEEMKRTILTLALAEA